MRIANVGTSAATLRSVLSAGLVRTLLSVPLALVSLPIILQHVGLTDYGVWATASGLLALGALAEGGIRTEAVRRVSGSYGADDMPEVYRHAREAFTLLSGIGLVVAVAAWFFVPFVVDVIFLHSDLAMPISELILLVRLLFVLLGASLALAGAYATLAGLQRSDIENWAMTVSLVVGTAVAIGGSMAGWGVWALFGGSVVQMLIPATVVVVALRRVVPGLRLIPTRLNPTQARRYLGLSMLLLLMQVSNVVDYEWDKIVLTRLVSPAAAAQYDIGSTLTIQGRTLALLPVSVLLAGLAELLVRQPSRAWFLYDQVVKATLTAALGVFGAMVLFADGFIRVWLGPGKEQTALATMLLAVAMYVNALAAPAVFLLIARGQHRLIASMALVNILVNGVASLALTQQIGFSGALIGSILANTVSNGLLFLVLRLRHRDVWRRSLGAPLAVAVVCSTVAALLRPGQYVDSWLSLVVAVAAWLTLVALVSVAMRAVDLSAMRRLVRARRV